MIEDPGKQLIYAISHDFGAPLRRIQSFSQLLHGSLKDRLSDKEERWFDFLLQESENAQAMLQGILNYSRIINAEYAPSPVELSTIVAQLILKLETNPTLNAEINVHNLPTISGNRTQWHQYFEAIIDNAIKYQPEGQAAKINIYGKVADNNVEIVVEDNGLGVDEDKRSSITAILKRYQTDIKGLGMGLALCKGVVNNHNGTLSFDDSGLGGLAVHCLLPIDILLESAELDS